MLGGDNGGVQQWIHCGLVDMGFDSCGGGRGLEAYVLVAFYENGPKYPIIGYMDPKP